MASPVEKTLSIIKPDAVNRHLIGEIISRFEKSGLYIRAMRLEHLSRQHAETFYAVHKARPFYDELVTYISSAPVVLIVLEGPDAVRKNREIMGATNPSDALCGTIRHDLALSIGENSVHGSDSLENAKIEISYFFPEID